MPTLQVEEDDDVIIVEFAPVPGVRSVALTPKDVIEKSQEAIDNALKNMRKMAKKTARAIKKIPITEKPGTIGVSFGLKLTAEGGAVLAKAGVEAGINVTMTWQDSAPSTKSRHK